MFLLRVHLGLTRALILLISYGVQADGNACFQEHFFTVEISVIKYLPNNVTGWAIIVAQWVQPLPVMLTYYVRALILFLITPLVIQLPPNAFKKTAENAVSVCTFALLWET